MYTHPETGQRMVGPTTFSTKAEGTRWLATIEADLVRGDALDVTAAGEAFGPYAEAWLASKKNLRPKTQELYEYLLRGHILPTFGGVAISQISTARVRAW